MPGDIQLSVKDLSVSFSTDKGNVPAARGVSFDLPKSSTLGIVGESGSGKSVTALTIMGLLAKPAGKIDGGTINFICEDGQEINLLNLGEKGLRQYRGNEMAMIFQEPMTSLNPVFTCGNQVSEAIREHNKISSAQAKEKTIALFEEVKLPRPRDIYNSYPHQLSGGQKQRVMIAMAMSCNPSVLIADEPTTALDVTVQKNILQLMKSLQQKHGMAIIFISHDLGVIAEIAENVMVMYQGEVVEQGSVRDIFRFPRHPYTKGLLACRPTPNISYRRLPTIDDYISGHQDVSPRPSTQHSQDIRSRQEKMYKERPLLILQRLKTYFPVSRGVFKKTKDYVRAVDDVNLEVYPGEILGLVGESGCGKTTLGRTILKLNTPSEGRIIFENENITNYPSSRMKFLRKKMQIIFQDPYSSLNPRLPVGTSVSEPMTVHGIHDNEGQRREMAIELLKKVNLDSTYYHRYPHELSGGQRQRICIARALAVKPSFIICDESVSALDVSIQAQILNLLMDLREEYGLTYIFISHDLSVVKFMSERMAVMKDGRIVEMGNSDDIYNRPKSDYTQSLIEAIPKGEIT
jgi:peptide/nickel transport system ATP-binding protein